MTRHWGLQATMTATYVAVTAVAVLLTELAIFGTAALSPPTPFTKQQVQGLAESTANGLAAKIGNIAGKSGGEISGNVLSTPGIPVTPGHAQPDGSGGVTIPPTSASGCDLATASFATIVTKAGTVLATSYPACYPSGSRGSAAQGGRPAKALTVVRWLIPDSGLTPLPGGTVAWAAAPIVITTPGKDPTGQPSPGPGAVASPATAEGLPVVVGKVIGMLYVQVPAVASSGGVRVAPGLVAAGLAVLAAAIPVGLAFGLLSTRRLTRRLQRLAGLTLAVADGGFDQRVPVSGHDEVSQLEENFNRMAGQLQASLDATRELVEDNGRHQERTRIARELHDSISQELFSLSVLAGGLRRTLPAGSALLPQVETMERTAGETMREMQSLLLALRPVTLDEAGLAGAIDAICHAYGQRLGVLVSTELEPVTLEPALEHAILRVAQEALGNAVRHAAADRITVRLYTAPGCPPAAVTLEISDNGRGFDVSARQADSTGLGLRTMRDRVAENGGLLTVDAAPGSGTRLRASFPRAAGDETAPRQVATHAGAPAERP